MKESFLSSVNFTVKIYIEYFQDPNSKLCIPLYASRQIR